MKTARFALRLIDKMNTVTVILAFVLSVFLPAGALEIEQACSKFPYVEQMLGKVMKIEAKMEQWDKDLKRFEEVILSVLEHRRQEIERRLEKFSEVNEKLRDEITNRSTEGDMRNPIIAFNAYTTVSGHYPVNQTVIFPEVLLNEGGRYDLSTGKFTAPFAGLYYFTAHVCHPSKKYMVISIMHGENKIAVGTAYEDHSSSCSSVSAPVIMEAGEYVYFKSSYEYNYLRFDGHRWPSFMGILVQKRR